jgi:coenzyme PQQ precursor peptide PqqA
VRERRWLDHRKGGTLVRALSLFAREVSPMTWTKPEFEAIDVTMEVTAYVARR